MGQPTSIKAGESSISAYIGGMTDMTSSYTDARGLLYRDGMLDPDGAKRVTAAALKNCDDGELYLQYRATESFGFDDGRLKTAVDQSGFDGYLQAHVGTFGRSNTFGLSMAFFNATRNARGSGVDSSDHRARSPGIRQQSGRGRRR